MDLKSYPLTREQQGLWIDWKINPAGLSYNTCVQMRLEGDLDVSRFCRAAADVIDFFELLRSHCTPLDDQVLLTFSDRTYTLETIDLWSEAIARGDAEESELVGRAMEILEGKRRAVMDLTRFPLIRAALVRTAPRSYYFTGVVPHIVSDGASALYFLMAFSTAYNRGTQGLYDEFAERNRSWGDYLAYRRETTLAGWQEAAMEYWRQNLSGANHRVELSRIPGDADSSSGAREYLQLSEQLSKRLKAMARMNRTTLFSVMAALFSSFLSRYTGQSDMLIGYPVDLRPRGFRFAFGFFVNVIPLRVTLTEDLSFAALIRQIHQQRKRDRKFQALPSLDIIKAHRKDTPGFEGPMFNVSMAETVSRLQKLQLDDIDCLPLDPQEIDIRDDLVLIYEARDQGIGIWLEFRKELFDAQAQARIRTQLMTLIKSVVRQPESPIAALQISNTTEQNFLRRWNQTEEPYRDLKLHQFFEHQVLRTPHALALQTRDEQISYGDLNSRANSLAEHLFRSGVQKDGSVALLLPRSTRQIEALLAVLKTGAAYLPLDPDWPEARIDFILRQARPSHLITLRRFQTTVLNLRQHLSRDDVTSLSVCFLDNIPQASTPENRIPETHSGRLAYTIYTSGSTGEPKGVRLSHRAVATRIDWLSRHLPLSVGDKMMQNTSYTFDVSVAEIFWPLACGATLVLVEPGKQRNPGYLADLIHSSGITTACLVPSALNQILNQARAPDSLDSLTTVICAGEVLPVAVAESFFKRCQGRLYNFYGPTETAIYATYHECQRDAASVPIGSPLGNTTCHILDSSLQPVPLGARGELYIGGIALAEGYVADSETTARVFIENPFGDGKLYRSGDRVQQLDSGELEFIQRVDDQIKLRGYRIEPVEISSRLIAHPNILDAAVILIPSDSGEPRLCAYYCVQRTSSGGSENQTDCLDTTELRKFLARHLPDYMIPNLFIAMEHLPRLSSGKIDTRRLPRLADLPDQNVCTPPETEKEKALAGIFADVLRIPVEALGTESDFFELGGDSMMIIEVACAAEEHQIFLETHEYFVYRSIAEILKHAGTQPAHPHDQSPVEGAFPALPRHIKLFRDGFASPAHWNRHLLIKVQRYLPPELVQTALNALMGHHDGLRIAFPSETQAHNAPRSLVNNIQVHDLTTTDSKAQASHIQQSMSRAHESLQLHQAPLFRVLLFQTRPQECQLALILHHLLIDMHSSRILLEDLMLACHQQLAGIPIQFPPKTTSVKVWSERIRFYAQNHDFSGEVSYWTQRLEPADRPLEGDLMQRNPSEPPATLLERNQIKQRKFLKPEITQALTTAIRNRLDTEMHQLVLWSLAEVLHETFQLDALVFNTCGHGREKLFDDISLGRTVGELNTVYPMRLALPLREGLRSIKMAYHALPSHGRHYGMLRYLVEEPQITRLREPEIFFNYVSRIDTRLPDTASDLLPVELIEPPAGVHTTAPENKVCYRLYIEAGLIDERLFVSVSHDKEQFSTQQMGHLLNETLGKLTGLVQQFPDTTSLALQEQPDRNRSRAEC